MGAMDKLEALLCAETDEEMMQAVTKLTDEEKNRIIVSYVKAMREDDDDMDDEFDQLGTYYRVETMDEDGKTVAGYMGTVNALLAKKLGIDPTASAEEIQKALAASDEPDVRSVFVSLAELCDIPYPDIYVADTKNHYCLYQAMEFDESYPVLTELDSYVREWSDGRFHLIYKWFPIRPEEIEYEDDYQIVISRELYEELDDGECYLLEEYEDI